MMYHAFSPYWVFIPICWFLLLTIIVLAIVFGRRRWYRPGQWGNGAWGGYGPWGGPWNSTADAERTLAERFANGDIDEKEYRARLEVLRANRNQPGPQ
jgi:putative membrane protein